MKSISRWWQYSDESLNGLRKDRKEGIVGKDEILSLSSVIDPS